MHSLFLTALSEQQYQEAKEYPDFFQYIVDTPNIYRTSFEHYCEVHLNFLSREVVSLFKGSWENNFDFSILNPNMVKTKTCELNFCDLNVIRRKAHSQIGERYDADTFIDILEKRLIPIFNYAANHDHYILLDFG